MATHKVDFSVLDVGQGSCNYVEIFDEGGALTNNLLIDLGTNSSQAIAAANLKLLRERIIARGRYLDVLILTHGDTDHYNMIASILEAFGPPAANQIGMVRYGGPSWRYAKGRLITTLKKYTAPLNGVTNLLPFTASQTGYDATKNPVWSSIWKAGDEDAAPKLHLIVANTPNPEKDPADLTKRQSMHPEAVNTRSVVAGLEWDRYWIIATGDATATTLADINNILAMADVSSFPKTFMLTLPHHGSRKTTYNLKKASLVPKDENRAVVNSFLDKFSPRTISISAAEKTHHHPSMYMIRQFADKMVPKDPFWWDEKLAIEQHFLTSWIDLTITPDMSDPPWPARWLYATTRTRRNIFSTYYFKNAQYNNDGYAQYLSPPVPAIAATNHRNIDNVPMGRNWIFRMEGETLDVESTENPARAAAARADFVATPRSSPPSSTTPAGREARVMLGKPGQSGPLVYPFPRPIAEPLGPRLGRLRTIR
jgi:hypothetical protein